MIDASVENVDKIESLLNTVDLKDVIIRRNY